MATGKKKSYTLSEAFGYLDNLEISPVMNSKVKTTKAEISTDLYSVYCKVQ